MIYKDGKPLKPFKGKYAPLNVYRNGYKLAGWHEETKTGEQLEFTDTYNDVAKVTVEGSSSQEIPVYREATAESHVITEHRDGKLARCEVLGETVQMADYYSKDGASEQVQTVLGKNIVDVTKIVSVNMIQGAIGKAYKLNLLPNTTYTSKSGINKQGNSNSYNCYAWISTDINSNFAGSSVFHWDLNTGYTKTFTTDASSTYYFMYVSGGCPVTLQNILVDYQLELGSVATTYTPFVPNSPSADYPSPITPNVLAGDYKVTTPYGIYEFTLPSDMHGIGGVADRVVFDKWSKKGYLDGKCGKKVFTGDEISSYYSEGISTFRFDFYLSLTNGAVGEINKICSHFKVIEGSNEIEHIRGSYTANTGNLVIFYINKSRLVTLDTSGMTQWITTNKPTIIYQLATPTRTPLTFTKVPTSTAPEFPLTSLVTTPSLDTPHGVYSVGGNMVARGKNLFTYELLPKTLNGLTLSYLANENCFLLNGIANNVAGNVDLYVYPTSKIYMAMLTGTKYVIKMTRISGTGSLPISSSARANDYTGISTTLGISDNTGTGTYTVPSDKLINRMYINVQGQLGVFDNLKFTIQLEEGTVATPYEPFQGYTQYPLPPLNRIGEVADRYDPISGILEKKISDWVELGGDKNIAVSLDKNYEWKKVSFPVLDTNYNQAPAIVYSYNSTQISKGSYTSNYNEGYYCGAESNRLYMTLPASQTGFGSTHFPSPSEVKAYFYGWKMCHSDGNSPYYRSEIPYNPETWEEWTAASGLITKEPTGMTLSGGSGMCIVNIGQSMKSSTKYGMLINVLSNTLQGSKGMWIGGGMSYPLNEVIIAKVGATGNRKYVGITSSQMTSDRFLLATSENSGCIIKFKDIRIYELPAGSQIETDFNTLTADELAILYPFYGLNDKHWKHVTDGLGLTNVLPTASYEGYTPYKMLYQLATPVVTQHTPPTDVPLYVDYTSVIESDSPVQPDILVGYRVKDSLQKAGDLVQVNPYTPTDILSTQGELVSRGRNLFDGIWENKVTSIDGTVSTNLQFGLSKNFIPVIPGSIISVQAIGSDESNIATYDKNQIYITNLNTLSSYKRENIQLGSNVYFVRLRFKKNGSFPLNTLGQLEYGSIATPYTPFRGYSSLPIPTLRGIPNGSGGWVVRDSIEFRMVSGVLRKIHIQRVGRKVFDGSDGIWSIVGGQNRTFTCSYDLLSDPTTRTLAICSHFKNEVTYDVNRFWIESSGKNVRFTHTDFTDVNLFKTWLGINKPTIDCQLAIPIETDLGPVDLPSFYPTTILEQNTDVKGLITATTKVMDT